MHKKMVKREVHKISMVPRPLGELTQPSLWSEDVALVVVVVDATAAWMIRIWRGRSIVPGFHCGRSCRTVMARIGAPQDGKLRRSSTVPQETSYKDSVMSVDSSSTLATLLKSRMDGERRG